MKLSLSILVCCVIILSCSHAVTIKCNYYMDNWWESNGNLYQCRVENADIFKSQRVSIDRANGEHESGRSDDNVESFYLPEASDMEKFPANLGNVFRNLQLILVTSSNLNEITKEDLKQFPNLKNFKLQHTHVEYIGEDLFLHNPLLEVVYFYGNRISHIDRRAFSGLSNLRAFDFRHNVCELSAQVSTRWKVLEVVSMIEGGECQSTTTMTTTTKHPLQVKIDELTSQLDEQRREIENLRQENQKLTHENGTCSIANQQLETQVNNCAARYAKTEQNVEKLLEKMEQQAVAIAGCNNDGVVKEINALSQQFANFTSLLDQLAGVGGKADEMPQSKP